MIMRTIKYFLLLIITSVYVSSCSKDKDEDEVDIVETGSLTIEGVEYTISHGEILRFENLYSNVYYTPLYFLSSDFVLGDEAIAGVGQMVEMIVFTNNSNEITPGNYTIVINDNYVNGTFILGCFTDFHDDTWEISSYYSATSGNLDVTKTRNVYTMNISVLADKYDLETAGIDPIGDPVATDIPISCTITGDLKQKYFE